MKKSYIIGGVIVVGALVMAMFSFKSTLTSYVTIKEAKASERHVQVAGTLVAGSTKVSPADNLLIFDLEEPDGARMTVHYNKSKPANFENAEKIVAIGRYDSEQQVFLANELLVKCPSKYEGRTE
ncbi:cytochrome c maturation protein CcmE [candidate division KSB1 bacterium]|nr:cytochrome c maturation protein CcmE [candidate division KSB1 bacterium]